MAKDNTINPKEFDPANLTADAVRDAVKEVEAKWHNLGNGIQTKAKLEDKMESKLAELVEDSKRGDWKKYLEEAIVQMITYNYSSNESLMWYGHLVTACELKRDLSMPSPAGVRFMFNKYELFINPLIFGLYTTDEQIAILKHEMLHIINLHIVRQKDREHKKWNYGTDIAINQLIANIPADGLHPEKFGFEKNLNAEQYYEMIPTSYESEEPKEGKSQSCSSSGSGNGDGSGSGSDENDGEGNGDGSKKPSDIIDDEKKLKDMILSALSQAQKGMIGDHSKWNESQGDAEAAKEITRQMTETATNKSRGMSPVECTDALARLKMKEQINWKKELRRIVGNRKAYSKLTIKKNDRRFPGRKDLRGKTKDHVADIIVVLDVSGSMSDEEIVYGLNEIRAICEKAGAGVKIIQVDTEPKLVENFDPKAKNFIRKGFGGTFMSPAYKMIVESKIRCDAVITITDGFIEHTLDDKIPKVPFIFLVTRNKENLALDISANPRMKSHTLEIDQKK